MRRPMGALLGCVMLVAACTPTTAPPETPTPTETTPTATLPPVGLRLGVVLPTSPLVVAGPLADLRARLEQLPDEVGNELSAVRVITPDTPEIAADAAGLLASRGYDVTCVMGPNAPSLVQELAMLYPAQWFCTAPGGDAEDTAENVIELDLRLEEVGHLLGLAAGLASPSDAPVALVLGSRRLWQEQLIAGVAAGVGDRALVRIESDDPDEIAEALQDLEEDGLRAVVIDASSEATEGLAGLVDLRVAGPSAILDADDGGQALLGWGVDLAIALQVVIDRARGTTTEVPETLGLGDGVFVIRTGDGLRGPWQEVVEEAQEAIEDGRRDPLMPAPELEAEPSPTPTPPASPEP